MCVGALALVFWLGDWIEASSLVFLPEGLGSGQVRTGFDIVVVSCVDWETGKRISYYCACIWLLAWSQ